MSHDGRDPGLDYLYASAIRVPPAAAGANQQQQRGSQLEEPVLLMHALPRSAPQLGEQPSSKDWGSAMGNMETAKLAIETLRGLIMDAVFLDEEAYTHSATLQLYQQRLQAQQRRILQLEGEAEAMRVEAGRQQEALSSQRAQTRAAEARIHELQQELENNAVVFDMHYNELLLKNEEIQRLKTVIEGLGSMG